MENVEVRTQNLQVKFDDEHETEQRENLIRQYLSSADANNPTLDEKVQNIVKDLPIINYNGALTLDELHGKLVLLDFFTYCCINCIHIMPFLHRLESKYSVADGFVVIGVHSAKFPNEKMNTNIENAVLRNNLQHPVLNDFNLLLWNEMCIKCWPTLVLLSPHGKFLFSLPGESHLQFVEFFIDVAMKFYKSNGLLKGHTLPIDVSSRKFQNLTTEDSVKLNFPSKICIDKSGQKIAIADTGNHRIIICDSKGRIIHMIGGIVAGFTDGDFSLVQFNSPQGVVWHGPNSIFVADCNNHAVRKIDLLVKKVVSVAGTGEQGSDLEGGRPGIEQPLSSPWDLVIGGSPRDPDGDSILYIAMSGCHQLWALFLKTADYQKGAEMELGTCVRYAGSGREENRNNSYPHKAGFAQPSGLALDKADHALYVADSESSTIRRINLSNGAVQALVGGDIDPLNLFAFGDVDGKGREAKLQHPLGVTWDQKRNLLYVADSYNHKIKVINPKKKTCEEFVGLTFNGEKMQLNEPGGICLDDQCEHLYIADTNNHDIKVVNLKKMTVESLNLSLPEEDSLDEIDGPKVKVAKSLVSPNTTPIMHQEVTVSSQGKLRIKIAFSGYKLNSMAPSSWQLSANCGEGGSESEYYFIKSGKFKASSDAEETLNMSDIYRLCHGQVPMARTAKCKICSMKLCVECMLYYCLENSDVCKMLGYKCVVPLTVIDEENGGVEQILIHIK